MGWYVADFYINSETLKWATEKGCPSIFNEYIADILVDALGINGTSNVFCRCQLGGYNLSWVLENGEEYARTFSEEELLDALKDKIVDFTIKVRKSE